MNIMFSEGHVYTVQQYEMAQKSKLENFKHHLKAIPMNIYIPKELKRIFRGKIKATSVF